MKANEQLDRCCTDFYYDENLREVPLDPEGMRKAAEVLLVRYNETGDVSALGEAGTYFRILGDLESAEELLEIAIEEHMQSNNRRGVIANSIRLAHIYQWQKRFAEADELFEKTIAEINEDELLNTYLDFAYQHLGKSKFDQGRYEEARELFEMALRLRREKGDEELIESSDMAMRMVEEKNSTFIKNTSP